MLLKTKRRRKLMKLHNYYSIYDKKAGEYGTLMMKINDAVAVRELKAAVNKKGNPLNEFNKDFALYKIGAVDIETGNFKCTEKPVLVVECAALLDEDNGDQ